MSTYTTDTYVERTSPTREAVLAWLADHHDLPVKYHDGQQWHTTPPADDRFAWYARVQSIGFDDVQVTGADPQHRPVGQPVHVSGATAQFRNQAMFRVLLGDAVAHALDAVAPARRRGRR